MTGFINAYSSYFTILNIIIPPHFPNEILELPLLFYFHLCADFLWNPSLFIILKLKNYTAHLSSSLSRLNKYYIIFAFFCNKKQDLSWVTWKKHLYRCRWKICFLNFQLLWDFLLIRRSRQLDQTCNSNYTCYSFTIV